MNTIDLEEALDQLVQDVASGICSLHDFPFRLMEAYQASRNEVKKLRMKHPEVAAPTDIVWPKKLLYRSAARGDVQPTVDALKASLIGKKGQAAKDAPRFIMSTDGDEFLAVDTKTGDTPAFDKLTELPVNYDFLQPMFGVERYKPAPETEADVRAARHMAKFHDAIRDANPDWGADHIHDLNLFMTRILFCMFAEDTGIFEPKLFVESLRREATQVDGSDTQRVIEDIFLALDIADKEARAEAGVRSRRIASDFPYVNGGLFRDHTRVPIFSRRARRMLLEAADLKWHQINADIFGSMIQAIVHKDMRADFGMHYTSVPNIMKVLDPLFLASLREQLTMAGDNVKALERLVDRISRIRVFDPACGSGNFLIIAYRELRLIETEAFRRIRDVKRKGQLALADFHTGILISNFYGIDPADFACETAKLSLWISQYQMNRKLDEICSTPAAALPLTDAGNIIVGNALQTEWDIVCPPSMNSEIYIVGNPPYLGRSEQNADHKMDMDIVFRGTSSYRKLDYVACWFHQAAAYIRNTSKGAFAFVATNSLCQGEQVYLLWPSLLSEDLEIIFAYEAFRWANSAAANAGVTCVVIGVGQKSNKPKLIFGTDHFQQTSNINPYLAAAPTIYVHPVRANPQGLAEMSFGNQILDGGFLTLSSSEKDALISSHPESAPLVKRLVGSKEHIQGDLRYCLWIDDASLLLAKAIPELACRLEKVRAFRAASSRAGTIAAADFPYRYGLVSVPPSNCLIVPRISSERRRYIPVGFVNDSQVVTDQIFAIPDAPTWLFALLSSRLHIVWALAVGGQLETRLRYSNTLVYNTFPVPALSNDQAHALESHALDILRVREAYIADSKTIAWLYNPETMPANLAQAHHDLDDYLETIYIGRPFQDDAERLEHLFKLYARMTKKTAKAA